MASRILLCIKKIVDIHQPGSYAQLLRGHDAAICTLGIGEPSKVSRETYIAVDKTAVLAFAQACLDQGVRHFELLASVGSDATSRSWYLRIKGELIEELQALNFERLSIFLPSMILTPTNRYGLLQGVLLKVWPLINPLLFGNARRFRGVRVETLGAAMAHNLKVSGSGFETLTWRDFQVLVGSEH